MRLSGFTFVKDAVKYDFPVVESIHSLLPICDEVIVNVGHSNDETLSVIQKIKSDKIKIVENIWDTAVKKGGRILALQTDLAKKECKGEFGLYLQADEILHEQDYPLILRAVGKMEKNKRIDGVRFSFLHFYGNYKYYQDNRRLWYRRSIRLIRNIPEIISGGDAVTFERSDKKPMNTFNSKARIFHYGWVRSLDVMTQKMQNATQNYWDESNRFIDPAKTYWDTDFLRAYKNKHPVFMASRILYAIAGAGIKPTRHWTIPFQKTVVFLWPVLKRIRWLPEKYLNPKLQP
jgi:hypothetical protein